MLKVQVLKVQVLKVLVLKVLMLRVLMLRVLMLKVVMLPKARRSAPLAPIGTFSTSTLSTHPHLQHL